MRSVFADTHFFLALVNPSDEHHSRALEWIKSQRGPAVTTHWVLAEFGNSLRSPENRYLFVATLAKLRVKRDFEIIPAGASEFEKGVTLFSERPDKHWSLTDCISFAVMQERNIREALTGDHHFEQAGFVALLK